MGVSITKHPYFEPHSRFHLYMVEVENLQDHKKAAIRNVGIYLGFPIWVTILCELVHVLIKNYGLFWP